VDDVPSPCKYQTFCTRSSLGRRNLRVSCPQTCIRNTLLMGASWKRQRNVWKRQRNTASLRRHAIAWLSWPRQNTNARPWKKWLRLGEWCLRRRITKASSQPIVSRQPRLRTLLTNETTLVPCAAAKPALAHLRRCALAIGTLERSGDTVLTLPRRNASPIPQRESGHGRSLSFDEKVTEQRAAQAREVDGVGS
jgi:hypothetical protein